MPTLRKLDYETLRRLNEAARAADATRADKGRVLITEEFLQPRMNGNERESEVVDDAPPFDFGPTEVNEQCEPET